MRKRSRPLCESLTIGMSCSLEFVPLWISAPVSA